MPMSAYNHTLSTDEEVLIHVVNSTGIIALNRPKALNALSLNIIRQISKTLSDWRNDDAVHTVIFEGVGEKSFCAGGDIRAVYDARQKGDRDFGDAIFREEYMMNHAIHTYDKPIISLIDGYCMGGGMGLSVHGKYRIVTEKATMAMPETTIGFFPDVGAGYFLNACPEPLGLWMGLLGEKIYAGDMIATNLATHFVPSQTLDNLRSSLIHPDADIEAILADYAKHPPLSMLKDITPLIELTFSGVNSVEEIIKNLESHPHPKAKEWLNAFAKKSPTSLKLSFENLKRARGKSISDVLHQEFRISQRCVEGHDFIEGIRALLVDKDQSPAWQPASLSDVTDAMIDAYFAPFTNKDELFSKPHVHSNGRGG